MVNEDIVTALRNAVNKGEPLEDAVRVMINSGYNPQEVEEASHFVAGGVSRILEPKKEEQFLPQKIPPTFTKPLQNQNPIPLQKNYQQLPQLLQVSQTNQQQISQQSINQIPQTFQQTQQNIQQTPQQTWPQQAIQQQQINQVPKEKPKKKSYWIEIILFIILLLLIGVLTATVVFKDQILAMNHNSMRRLAKPYVGTSQFDVPGLEDNSIVIAAENLTQIPFENVLRAYMAKSTTSTSLYQHYIVGERTFCGHKLSEDLVPNGLLPYVMDTPSTKSDEHDESVSSETLFERNILTREQYGEIKRTSLEAFAMVSRFLRTKRLILVDTKTEHGINREGKIISQDELYTMDSSRFWLLDDYEKQRFKLARGEIEELNPKSYSKEFARGFSKGENGYTDEQKIQIAVRYIEGIQHLLGSPFVPDTRSSEERIISGIETVLEKLVA